MLADHVVMDVEIVKEVDLVFGKWDNPEDMGLASAVVYDYRSDQYHFFLHEESREVLLSFLQGRICVTFNGIKFDSKVLLGNDRGVGYRGQTFQKKAYKHLPSSPEYGKYGFENYDILLEYIKFRFGIAHIGLAQEKLGEAAIHDGSFSLDGLAEGTLGMNKTGHGAKKAPILYQEKKYDELLAYNQMDVRLTRKLFEFIVEHQFVVDRNDRVVRILMKIG